jgi:hypothetical protein
MQLSQLAEDIKDYLNSLPEETWTDLKIGEYVSAENGLDPTEIFERGVRTLWILPYLTDYSRDTSQGRRQLVRIGKIHTVVMVLSIPFEDTDPNAVDVSSWEGIKKVLNFREEIEKQILLKEWGATISGIEAEPPEDIPLGKRWFYAVTRFEFESMGC